MAYGPIQKLAVQTMASGQTYSTIITMPQKSYSKYFLEIPTFASGADVYLQASTDGTNFRYVRGAVTAITQAVPVKFSIGSTVSQAFVEIPGHFPWLKIEISTFVTDTVTNFKIICID